MREAVQEATDHEQGSGDHSESGARPAGTEPGDRIRFVADRQGYRVQKPPLAKSPFDKWRGYAKELAGKDPDTLLDEWRGR